MKETGILGKLSTTLDKIARIFTQLSVFVMVVVVLLAVFMRYIMRNPLIWGDELSRYCLVYMTFVGASVALKDRAIAAMELIVEKLPAKIGKIVSILVCIIMIALLSFLFYYSMQLLFENSVKNQISPGLQMPMSWAYFSMPLGLGLMIIQAVFLLIEETIELKSINGGIRE